MSANAMQPRNQNYLGLKGDASYTFSEFWVRVSSPLVSELVNPRSYHLSVTDAHRAEGEKQRSWPR
eukprot:8072563-Pyramimonas_sp.AAC.1